MPSFYRSMPSNYRWSWSWYSMSLHYAYALQFERISSNRKRSMSIGKANGFIKVENCAGNYAARECWPLCGNME